MGVLSAPTPFDRYPRCPTDGWVWWTLVAYEQHRDLPGDWGSSTWRRAAIRRLQELGFDVVDKAADVDEESRGGDR